MPNPKVGTVTMDVAKAVTDELQRAKPAASKGRYLRRVTLATTMGPGVKVDPNRLRDEAAVS
jgi:large subunit ribosomal protein L1